MIDDHALIRDALRGVLKELNDRTTVLEASDGRQAMRLIGEHPDLDVILLDLNLPDRNGLSMLAELRKDHPEVSIVVLSAFNDRDNIVSALELGALGFIPKSAPREVMLGALRLVFSGGTYIPLDILKPQEPAVAPAWPATNHVVDGSSPSPGDLGLTDRQLDVLALMMRARATRRSVARLTGGADGEARDGDFQGPEGHEPHRGRNHGRGAGVEPSAFG